jgi:hypothetical protein
MKTLRLAPLFAALALLAGCASQQGAVGQAATTPLSDLNLVRAEIPPVLAAAQKAPYGPPVERSCAAIAAEVQALDAVLGADLDAPPRGDDPGLVERGGQAVGDVAVGAVRRTAEDVVPFRGWVRKLTGAERYERRVQAAVTAGTIRRAYLKGIAQSLGCAPPAGPRTGTQ